MTTPLASPLHLRAGPLSADFFPKELFLRYLRVGRDECLRGIYLAIRDEDWNTLAPIVTVTTSDIQDRSFNVVLDARWEQADIRYRAECRLTGTDTGQITYHFKGLAESDFLRNRLGFVVLHGAQLAGQEVCIETVDGSKEKARFPTDISPHQPFGNLRAMTHHLRNGLRVNVRMEGDTYETEDQRNWTDASFKTYCTPLNLPFPVEVQKGDIMQQSITLGLEGGIKDTGKRESDYQVTLKPADTGKMFPIPLIGLETMADPRSNVLSEFILQTLVDLRPDHLRVSLLSGDPNTPQKLLQAQNEALAIGCDLEIALFTRVSDNLASFFKLAKERLRISVSRWMVFDPDTKATPPAATAAIKDMLESVGLKGPVGAGTDHFFTELNRERSAVEGADFACFSMNPQVHAFDDLSLLETMEMQGVCVKSTRKFSGNLPVIVSPLTFKMRSNPNATAPSEPDPPGKAPHREDPRQTLPFGAVWTLGSLLYLTEADVHAVTLFELVGPLGIMDASGNTFPARDAIALLTQFKGGALSPLHSSDPLKAIGFDLVNAKGDDRLRVLVNLMPKNQSVICGDEAYTLEPYRYKTWKI